MVKAAPTSVAAPTTLAVEVVAVAAMAAVVRAVVMAVAVVVVVTGGVEVAADVVVVDAVMTADLTIRRECLTGQRSFEVVTTQHQITATLFPAFLRSQGRPSPLQRADRKDSALPAHPRLWNFSKLTLVRQPSRMESMIQSAGMLLKPFRKEE